MGSDAETGNKRGRMQGVTTRNLLARVSGRGFLTFLLIGAFVFSLSSVNWSGGVMHSGGGAAIVQMVRAFFTPDLSAFILSTAITASWRTLAYATAGTSLAVIIAVPLGVLASGVLVRGPLAQAGLIGFFRAVLGLLRAVHELVWAWLFVAAIGLSPFAAIFALALPYGGILGRILADMLNDVPQAPLRALRSAGASEWQVLIYGRLPMAFADALSYILYRFECAIRSAAIMSFVGLGGLGFQIQLSLLDLRYNEAWTFVFFLIGLVVLVDVWSSGLRRRVVQ